MLRNETHHVIWDEDISDEEMQEHIAFYKEEYPDLSEDDWERMGYEAHQEYLNDEKLNLANIKPSNGILAYGTIGRWNGNYPGIMKHLPASVQECFERHVDGDSILYIYVDEDGDLHVQEAHHDGCNIYHFRAWNPDISEEEKDELQEGMLDGSVSEDTIREKTYRLGDLIGDVYGWTFPNRPVYAVKKGEK